MSRQITPEEAIRSKRELGRNRTRMKVIEKEHQVLRDEYDTLERDVRLGDKVRINGGRPYLSPWDSHFESLDGKRKAQFRYCTDGTVNVEGEERINDLQWKGVGSVLWVTEKEARKIALAWVLDGERPGEQERQERFRHLVARQTTATLTKGS